MLLTDAQLLEIKKIIEDHHNAFIVNAIDPKAVRAEVLEELTRRGLVNTQVRSIADAYLYGQVLAASQDPRVKGMNLTEFKAYLRKNPVPLSPTESQAVTMAQQSAAQYVRGLGNRVDVRTGQMLIEADAELRRKMRDTIRTKVEANIEARQSVKQLKSDLGWETKDWTRDLDRISVTEKQAALEAGKADLFAKQYGSDVAVAKLASPDCCDRCRFLYGGPDGAPRIFKLSELEANGTNVGRKAADWLPTVNPTHPHCLPPGSPVLTPRGEVPIESLRPGDRVMTHKGRFKRVRALWSSEYTGDLVEISTASRSLRLTPNHAIFTSRGEWLSAGCLETGTNIPDYGVQRMLFVKNPHTEDAPSKQCEKVSFAHVLYGFSRRGMPAAAIHFNGQFFLWEGEVNKKEVDDVPHLRRQAATNQQFVDTLLQGRFELSSLGLHYFQNGTRRLFAATHGRVRGIGNSASLLRRHLGVAQMHPFGGGAQWQPQVAKTSCDGGARHAERTRNSLRRLPVAVHLSKFLGIKWDTVFERYAKALEGLAQLLNRPLGLLRNLLQPLALDHVLIPDPVGVYGAAPGRNYPGSSQDQDDVVARQAELGAYVFDRHAMVQVQRDNLGVSFGIGGMDAPVFSNHDAPTPPHVPIVNVKKAAYRGVVYNLSVEDDESYVAADMPVHNCVCQLIRIPAGYGFNAFGDLVEGGELGIRYDAQSLRASLPAETALRKSVQSPGAVADFQNLPIFVENPVGSTRPWKGGETTMLFAYGYIQGTHGMDGEEIDCYLGPNPLARQAFVVHQTRPDGFPDEDKVFLGFSSEQEARDAFVAHRSDGERCLGGIYAMPMQAFKRWLAVHAHGDAHALVKADAVPQARQPALVISSSDLIGRRSVYADGNPRLQGYAGANFINPPSQDLGMTTEERAGDMPGRKLVEQVASEIDPPKPADRDIFTMNAMPPQVHPIETHEDAYVDDADAKEAQVDANRGYIERQLERRAMVQNTLQPVAQRRQTFVMRAGPPGRPAAPTRARVRAPVRPRGNALSKAEWNEQDHPRAADGKFGEGSGGPAKSTVIGKTRSGRDILSHGNDDKAQMSMKDHMEAGSAHLKAADANSHNPSEASRHLALANEHMRLASSAPASASDPPKKRRRAKHPNVTESSAGPVAAQGREVETPPATKPQTRGGHRYSSDELDAIDTYQGSRGDDGATAIETNAGLREGKVPQEHRAYMKHLDAALANSPLASDVTTYRGVNGDHLHHLKPGDVYADKGYASTSKSKDVATNSAGNGESSKQTVITIQSKKGQSGLDMNAASTTDDPYLRNQKEVLLPRDSKMRVVSSTITGNVQHLVVARV